MKQKVTLTIEKQHKESLFAYRIIEAVWGGESPINSEDLWLIEADGSAIPEFNFTTQEGDRIQFTSIFVANYTKDYWGEHDIDFHFDEVTDVTIWRIVYEEPKPTGDE
jgi:hypothetical protein